MFKIGQKVVCVREEWRSRGGFQYSPELLPKKDEIYTVEEVNKIDGFLVLWEMEINARFNPSKFRPIVDIGDQVEEHIKSLQPVETLETV